MTTEDLARIIHRETWSGTYSQSWDSATPTRRQQCRKAAMAILVRIEDAA